MLELKNITFQVEEEQGGNKEIIRDISLVIPDNQFVVITGPNGGGKSTLARLIAGIEKPESGQILLDGTDITDMSVTERARHGISFAFQQPVRFKGIQVIDLIRLAAGKNISVSGACEYLASVGLCARDYIQREVNSSLSGGELKRIEIATVLARKTRLSVFDEPEAGIGAGGRHRPLELPEPDPGVREHEKDHQGQLHPHHLPPGAYPGDRRPDRGACGRKDLEAGPAGGDPAAAYRYVVRSDRMSEITVRG